MINVVRCPFFSVISVIVIIVPRASIAHAVVVSICVRSSCRYVVVTENGSPVLVLIVFPGSVFMLVIVIPRASFADSIIVFIYMCSLILAFNLVSASSSVPVMSLVMCPVV